MWVVSSCSLANTHKAHRERGDLWWSRDSLCTLVTALWIPFCVSTRSTTSRRIFFGFVCMPLSLSLPPLLSHFSLLLSLFILVLSLSLSLSFASLLSPSFRRLPQRTHCLRCLTSISWPRFPALPKLTLSKLTSNVEVPPPPVNGRARSPLSFPLSLHLLPLRWICSFRVRALPRTRRQGAGSAGRGAR